MAIAFANLGASTTPDINSGTAAASYASASWTPPTSGLIILFVTSREAAGLNTVVSVTGNSITWTQIATMAYQTSNALRITLFAANAVGSSTGATTIDFGANAQLSCRASFFQATGVDLTGGVAAAFVQTPNATGTGTSGSITLGAAGDANNRPIVAFSHIGNEATTPRTNWTELDDLAGAAGVRSIETQYRGDAFETTASATWTTSALWGGLAAELKVAGAAGISFPFVPQPLRIWTRRR